MHLFSLPIARPECRIPCGVSRDVEKNPMKNFFVYILKCNDGSYYVGHTDDIEKRISEHKNRTYQNYTALRLPIELVFSQIFETRDEAFIVERKIKDWSRKKKEALIRGNYDLLALYAKKKFD